MTTIILGVILFLSLLPSEITSDQFVRNGGHRWNGRATPPTISQCVDDPSVEPPICVVGGGITGLTIATKLQDAGRRVLEFEKAYDHVGGKLDTEAAWDAVWEKGPVLFSSGEEAINRYRIRFKQKKIRWFGENVGVFNPLEAVVREIPQERLDKMRKNRESVIQAYSRAWRSYPPWVFESRGFEHVHLLKTAHPDLFLNTKEWLVVHHLDDPDLEWAFGVIFTCEGYGLIEDLPALYMLRLIFPKVFVDLFDLLSAKKDEKIGIYTLDGGFAELATAMAADIKCLFLACNVMYVNRTYGNQGRLTVEWKFGTGNLGYSSACSKVILAFPPLLGNLLRMMDDLTKEEKGLLQAVKVHKYFSSGHLMQPEPNRNVYLGTVEDTWLQGDGQPIALVRSGKGNKSDAYTIYSWMYGRYDAGPVEEDFVLVNTLLRLFLDTFTHDTPRIGFLEGYEYFPHLSSADIAAGWFYKFAQIQGNAGVYYATTATSFESVNTAIENAEAVADLVLHY